MGSDPSGAYRVSCFNGGKESWQGILSLSHDDIISIGEYIPPAGRCMRAPGDYNTIGTGHFRPQCMDIQGIETVTGDML
jgi:hypothetical protein